jgi:2,4-dienoyl-CoA reductase-like NADH-dependent reductase (Old Yellow Enzyme family)
MWRPAERIRHTAVPGRWPSAEEAARSRLFSPVRVGPIELTQRTWVPAMVPWRATADGVVTRDVLEWYERFACGRPGAIVVEATGIREVSSGPLLRIGHNRFLPGLARLVETVHRASGGETRLFIQIIDFLSIRRRPDPGKFFERFLVVTDRHRTAFGADATEPEIRAWLAGLERAELERVLDGRELESLDRGYRERVTDMHLAHIRDLPRQLPGLFASAACRAQEADFDGVELHYAHAYTLASFLSPLNQRQDGYGGSSDGRLRLPLEIYARVKAEVSGDFAVGCRFLTEECVDGGGTIADARYNAQAFARAGMDFLSLSRGGKFDDAKQPKLGEAAYPYTGRSGYECMPPYYSDARGPFGRNVDAAAAIRTAVHEAGFDVPIVTAGGVHNFEQAEAMLNNGSTDIVGLARQALADPDWFSKVRSGHGDQVRLCLYTNYCEALDQRHRQVTCELWDREALDEPGIGKSSDGKRRLVAPAWRVDQARETNAERQGPANTGFTPAEAGAPWRPC